MKRIIFANLRKLYFLFFRLVGFLMFVFMKRRRRIALENVRRCGLVPATKIVRNSFISLGHTMGDIFLLPFYTKHKINDYVSITNKQYIEDALAKKRGVIFSTAHFGSWEFAAHSCALMGYKSLIVYNPFKATPRIDAFIKRRRELSGNRLISKQLALVSVYRHLKQGGMVTLVTDQHCVPHDGVRASLFGNPVWTHAQFIRLSLKTGAPIVPGFIFTKGLTGYEIEFAPPLYPEYFAQQADPVLAMAQKSNEVLEQMIIKSPGMWMWQHRRFKA